ncbi:MAG: alanine racemase [Lachnospiraceae bacterium]|nr:alanine racemase [Lachnospiraceae bacterium]
MVEMEYRKNYYRVYAKINLDALCSNIINIRKLVRPQTKIMAVIKADGYGHGAVPIARAFDQLDVGGECVVASYGVAIVEEGIELRRAGITKPILVLGYTPPELVAKAVQNDITLTVFEYSLAEKISREAVAQGRVAAIHIKVDTGMGRIGYAGTKEDAREVAQIMELPGIRIEGLFSHMACADEADKSKAYRQCERFMQFADLLLKQGVQIPVKHIANSAGIIDMPKVQFDMVRSGISTYGLYPSGEVDFSVLNLKPAMELVSHISFIKQVGEGYPVGYGSTFVTDSPTVIATIPVGYADGYPRALSNTGRVLVAGQYAPILGRICMDQFMVDVTHIPQAKQGEPVTLIGRDKEGCITVEEVAKLAGSFNYELICGISKRVPRIYFKRGKPVRILTEFAG